MYADGGGVKASIKNRWLQGIIEIVDLYLTIAGGLVSAIVRAMLMIVSVRYLELIGLYNV
jgi:hypothetical protein